MTEVKFERSIGKSAIVSYQEEKFLIKKEHLSGDSSKFTKGQMVDTLKKFLQPIIHNSKN